MSGFKGITVNTAPEMEPHIYAEDDAAIYQTIFGKDGVSTIGQQCAVTVISNNKVRVADGVICVGGHFGRIPYGEYVDCEIQNGKTGVNRNDIIVAKFETTGAGGIDNFTCEVIQGTAGSTATDPEISENDLYSGGTVREFPLYRVKLEGISIVSVDKLFNIVPTNAELLEKIDQLNSDLNNLDSNLTDLDSISLKKLRIAIASGTWPTIKIGSTTIQAPPVNLFGIIMYTSYEKSCIFFSLYGNNTKICVWNSYAGGWYGFNGTAL